MSDGNHSAGATGGRRRSAALAGAGVGLAAVALLFAAECLVHLGELGPNRLRFLRRIADLPADVVTAVGREMFVGLAAIYGLAALWVAAALALTNLTWHRLARVAVGRLVLWDLALLGWVVVAGQLQLMAVHPYARDDAAWAVVEPWLRAWWTPGLARAFAVVTGLALAAAVTRRLTPRRRVVAALPLLTFAPLLGPGGVDQPSHIGVPVARAPADAPPAVLIIGLDSLRPDFISALGGPRGLTPNIDAFLADAFVFTEAYTPIGRTHPSWISLLTARTPDRHGVRYNRPDPWFSARLPVGLAAHLQGQGWRTRFLTDDDLFSTITSAHGFDRVDQPPSVLRTYAARHLMDFGLMTLLPRRWTGRLVPDLRANRSIHHNYDARDFTERVLAAADEEGRAGGPFLLCAHLCVLHYPGTQPGPGFREHQPPGDGLPALGYFKVSLTKLARQDPRTSVAQATKVTGLYTAGVRRLDAEVGRLLAGLARSGLYDRAWIVLWSDHGESFTDPRGHPVIPNHGVYVDNGDQDLRVVLAIKAPRGRGPRGRSAALVRTIDVAPTLLDLLGLPPLPGPREGVSLRPALEGRPLPPLPHYAETGLKWGRTQHPREPPYSFHITQSFRYEPTSGDLVLRRRFHAEVVLGKHRALRRDRWKVAYHPTLDGGVWNLWDVERPAAGDLRDRHPEAFERLAAELRTHMADLEPERLRAETGGAARPLPPPWWPWRSPPPMVASPRSAGP